MSNSLTPIYNPATDSADGLLSAEDKAKIDDLGTASTHAATDFDAAGSASTAQSNAESFATAADSVVLSAAEAYAANASNLSSGTVPAARLPSPSASSLGGVQSAASVSHQWIDSISTAGVPHLSQPASTALSDFASIQPRQNILVIAASNSVNAATADVVCTGTADQVTINAAIKTLYPTTYGGNGNASTGVGVGGRVILRNGTYNITDSIVIDGSYITLEGESMPFWGAYSSPYAIGTPAGTEGFACAKIKATQALSTGTGMIEIRDLNTPDNGESLGRHRAIEIKRLYLYGFNFSNTGIYAHGGDDSCNFSQNCIQNTGNGIDLRQDNCTVFNNNIQSLSGDGITFLAAGGGTVVLNTVYDIGGTGLTLSQNNSAFSGITASLNTIGDCLKFGINALGNGMIISNNAVMGCGGFSAAIPGCGILLGGCTGGVISGNWINTEGSQTGKGNATGIYLTNSGKYLAVTGNTLIAGVATKGLAIDNSLGTNSYNNISGNTIGTGWNGGGGGAIAFGDTTNYGADANSNNSPITLYSQTPKSAVCTGWWKADALSLSDGNSVTSWADSSGCGLTLTGTAPVYHTNILNGLPGVLFNGSSQYLRNTSYGIHPQPRSILLVVQPVAFPGSGNAIPLSESGMDMLFTSAGAVNLSGGTSGGTLSTGTPYLLEFLIGLSGGSSSSIRINGGSATTVSFASSVCTGGTFALGAYSNGTQQFCNCYIFEALDFQGLLSAAELTTLRSDLLSKWGINTAYTPFLSKQTTSIIVPTLTGSATINAPSNTPSDGQVLKFRITQDATGGRTITWNSVYAWTVGIPSSLLLTSASSAFEVAFEYYASASKWYAIAINQIA